MTQEKTTKWPTTDKKETANKTFGWGISRIKIMHETDLSNRYYSLHNFFSSDPTLSCQKLLISWLPYHIYLMYLSSRPLPFCASARQLLFQKLPTAHRDYSTSARFWCTLRCIEAGRKQKTRCLDLLKSHDFSTCSFALRNNPSCALQFWSIGCVSRE